MKYNNSIPVLDLSVARKTSMVPFQAICRDKQGDPVDLTGWTAEAEVRRGAGQSVILDMSPTISDPTNGVIQFVNVNQNVTDVKAGSYFWDLVLRDAAGNAKGVFITGKFVVYDKITDSTVI